MIHLIQLHPFWSGVIAYWILSAAVDGMPDPKPTSSEFYLWLYKFSHSIAGNIFTAFGSKIPGLPPANPPVGRGPLTAFVLVLLMIVTLPMAGCTPVERAAYDTIVGSKAFLDSVQSAHPECAPGSQASLCVLLAKARAAKDLLIDAAEVYCSSPSFESGGACTPPMKGTPVMQQMSAKLSAAISSYQQAEKDLKGVIH